MNRHLVVWLAICCFMTICMIAIGGFTRLTGSGLSIVEWKPIIGFIPPLTTDEWLAAFDLYKNSPEYIKLNFTMELSEFKFIFFVEFIHRFFARLLGLVYLLPMLYFWKKGAINKSNLINYVLILILFGMQGFLGWYMVKSGLVDHPHVNHFRLALHMGMGILIYCLLFYQMLKNIYFNSVITSGFVHKIAVLLSIVIYLQVILGALVAGLKGGLVYNTFPLMGERFVPPEIISINGIINFLSDPVAVQFLHRIGGYIVFLLTGVLYIGSYFDFIPRRHRLVIYVCLAVIIQILLGIVTLIYVAPISFALIHQIWAVICISIVLWLIKFDNDQDSSVPAGIGVPRRKS